MAHRGSFTLVESCALELSLTWTCLGRELQQSQSDDSAPRTGILTDSMSCMRYSPNGARHVAKIRLNLDTIRKAYVAKKARLANGLIPFAGLSTTERYAEVLGHELAHAVGILLDQDYFQLYQELEREVAEYESLLQNPKRMPEDLERSGTGSRPY